MKKLALFLALTTAIPANAGGPVITEEEPLVAGDYAEKRGVNPLLILGGLLLIGALVSGGGDDPAPVTPAPEPQPDPGPEKPVCLQSDGC